MIVPDVRVIERQVFHARCDGCGKEGPDALDEDDAREMAVGDGWSVDEKKTLCEKCKE